MSNIKALEDLRVYANGWRNGLGGHPSDVETLADRIEREVSQRVAELNGAVCERDGRIGSYERRNTELNDALKAICKRFGVSTEWSAKDTAKKVLEALERGWMELPVDADGVPIRVGDKLRFCDFAVQCAAVSPERIYYWDEYSNGHWVKGVECRHVKPRTLEDVLASYRFDAQNIYEDPTLDGNQRVDELEVLDGKAAAEIRELLGVS